MLPQDSIIGRTLLHYRVLEKVGSGGMGAVFKAEDMRLGRVAALKFLAQHLNENDEARRRFMQEARAASSLDHPNICTIYGIEELEGATFIAMAYYEGDTVKQRIAAGAMPLPEVLRIALQLGEGLARAHEKGIVHRDIKPANVIISSDGTVKILDFGLALLGDTRRITRDGLAVGTASYMSPEQIEASDVGPQTDIWSFGVMLYEMLAGIHPFRGQADLTVMNAILTGRLRPLREARPDVPAWLAQIVSQALMRDRAQRYQSMAAVLRDLRSADASGFAETDTRIHSIPDAVKSSTGIAARQPSIAVLAFANLSRDEDNEYFSDGLTEELITALAQVEGLHVVSRSSAFEFKGKSLDIRVIGERLQVTTVLEGSIRRSGNRVRISAQLINVQSGFTLWSERYDRDMHDVFAIQDEIAQTVVTALKVKFKSGPEHPLVRHHTSSLEAWHLYLKGRYHWNKQTGEGIARALEYYQQSIAADAKFAPGHAGLAEYYIAAGFWSLQPPSEVWPKAKGAVLQALELAADDSHVHVSAGYVRIFCDWNWEEAGKHFRRAVELAPGDQSPHYALGVYLTQRAEFEEALEELRRALALDPLSLHVNSALAFALMYARSNDQAILQARKTLELDANYFEVRIALACAQIQKGRFEDAIQLFEGLLEASPGNLLILAFLGFAYAIAGRRERAAELLAQLESMSRDRYVSPAFPALIYCGLGEKDQAFAWLDRAVDAREGLLCYLNVLPCYDPLRTDPRFAALAQRIGLARGGRPAA